MSDVERAPAIWRAHPHGIHTLGMQPERDRFEYRFTRGPAAIDSRT
jgi:hypothetical protein